MCERSDILVIGGGAVAYHCTTPFFYLHQLFYYGQVNLLANPDGRL